MRRLLSHFALPLTLAAGLLIAWGLFLVTEQARETLRPAETPTPLPAFPGPAPYHTYQRTQGLKPVTVPREPLQGAQASDDPLETARQKVAAYRKRYRKGEWASSYWLAHSLAHWLAQERARRILEKMNGEASWEPLKEADGELVRLVEEAEELARTDGERRRSENLRRRALEGPAPVDGGE